MSASNPNDATGLHPTARPAEKRQDIEFEKKDAALRLDVHNLGTMIGELLREQGGQVLYELVESARKIAIDRREGQGHAGAKLDDLVRSLTPETARDFVRAFSTYFQVVNSAEQVHRIRRWRDYLKDTSILQPGGLDETIIRLRDQGMQLDDVLQLLQSMLIEPVFSADNIEPTRRTILRKQQNIIKSLVNIQNPVLTPREVKAHLEDIRTNITTIWQTEEHPHAERTVFDEAEHILFFMTDVIYRAIPPFYEQLSEALQIAYGAEAADLDLPTVISFGSLVGGDIQSRPEEITGRTIRETLARQRQLILDKYFHEVQTLAEQLSQCTERIKVSDELKARTSLYADQFPNTAGQMSLRHRSMPYRAFLKLVLRRLQATFDDDVYPYESAEEFLRDLQMIFDSLIANRGQHAGQAAIRHLMIRVKTFGFHFMTIDIRQSAMTNRHVVGHCLGENNWRRLSAEERANRLRTALERNESPVIEPDNQTRRALAIFQSISYCRRRFGKRAIGPYLISLAHGVDDVFSVLLLARWADLRKKDGSVPIDIAPYFETDEDLTDCADTMRELLDDDIYRQHLAGRDNHQIVMVRYSDPHRDVGLISARWALHQAQAALIETLDEAGISFTFFHGRGGTISRGGGRTHAAILGSPPGAIRGRLRATEQGELVNAKFGVRGIALRTLEQTLSAVTMATVMPDKPDEQQQSQWHDIVTTIVEASADRYRQLVYNQKNFYDYFSLATPVDAIQRMREVERSDQPAETGDLEGLRDVPWDYSWIQSRHILPGWYGIGTGLTAAISKHGVEAVREMVDSWYFFRAVLYDIEIVLAKTDLNIASRYSELAGDLHQRFFPLMRTEFDLSVEQTLMLRQQRVLLEKQKALRRSIRLRNPYVDPMSLLQVDLLSRWRAANRDDEPLFEALIASINGIARGLQDSG